MSKTPLWTVAEVARALRLSGDFPDTAIDFVTQDSRLVKPGSLFVALSGTPSGGFISSFASARNGWEFAASAEAAGAAAMIVPHRIDSVSVPQLVVPDTLLDGLWAQAEPWLILVVNLVRLGSAEIDPAALRPTWRTRPPEAAAVVLALTRARLRTVPEAVT